MSASDLLLLPFFDIDRVSVLTGLPCDTFLSSLLNLPSTLGFFSLFELD